MSDTQLFRPGDLAWLHDAFPEHKDVPLRVYRQFDAPPLVGTQRRAGMVVRVVRAIEPGQVVVQPLGWATGRGPTKQLSADWLVPVRQRDPWFE